MIRSVYEEAVQVQTWRRRESDQAAAREAITKVLEEQAQRSRIWKATPRPGAITRIVRLVARRAAHWFEQGASR